MELALLGLKRSRYSVTPRLTLQEREIETKNRLELVWWLQGSTYAEVGYEVVA